MPVSTPGAANGITTRQNVRHTDTPKVREAAISWSSTASNASRAEDTYSATAVKAWASTTANAVNGT